MENCDRKFQFKIYLKWGAHTLGIFPKYFDF
jgi:hypothetical protein